MRKEDVKIGMKVVPHDKTVGIKDLNRSAMWQNAKRNNQGYMFVTRYSELEKAFLLDYEKSGSGDYFNASDFEPYIENKTNSNIKYLTHDEIRDLPHGTKIKFTDNYDTPQKTNYGIINQKEQCIGGYGSSWDINNCHWFFDSLEERDVKAWIETEITENKTHNIKLIFNGTTTIAILRDKNGKQIKKSIAKLHPNDTYSKEEGIKIAILRVLGEDVKETNHVCNCGKKELKDYTNDELINEIQRRMEV